MDTTLIEDGQNIFNSVNVLVPSDREDERVPPGTIFYDEDIMDKTNRNIGEVNARKPSPRISRLIEPWAKIGVLRYNHIESVIMANIDSLTNFSGHHGGYLAEITTASDDRLSIFSINDAPGGMTDYMVQRRADLFGFAMSAEGYSVFDDKFLDHRQIVIWPGHDHSGNIVTNVEASTEYIRGIYHEGVTFIVAKLTPRNSHNEWWREVKPLNNTMTEDQYKTFSSILYTTLLNLSSNGKICIEFPETMSELAADSIYSLYKSFDKLSIIKPISSSLHERNTYVVCENMRVEQGDMLLNTGDISGSSHAIPQNRKFKDNILEEARKMYMGEKIERKGYPEEFQKWLSANNTSILNTQNRYLEEIQRLSSKYTGFEYGGVFDEKEMKPDPYFAFDRVKAIVLWNLKDTKTDYLLNSSVLS